MNVINVKSISIWVNCGLDAGVGFQALISPLSVSAVSQTEEPGSNLNKEQNSFIDLPRESKRVKPSVDR